MIIAFHRGLSSVPGAFYGLDGFFFLSGFLITSLLVKEWGRENDPATPPPHRGRAVSALRCGVVARWRVAAASASIDAVVVLDPSVPVEGSGDDTPGVPAVRRAVATDVDAMAAQLAKTFWDDPVTSFIFNRESRREAGLRAYFRTQMRADYLPFGGCYTTDGYAGSAIWAPAGKPLLTGLTGILTMLPVLRYVATRLVTTLRILNTVEQMHPHEPHWYLATLGTAVERQGQGVGSALMRPVLDHCDAEGLPCYLESSKERNVPFYNRHGFSVVQEVALPNGGPPIWTMWRDPQGG